MSFCHFVMFCLLSCLGSLAKQENASSSFAWILLSVAHQLRNIQTDKRREDLTFSNIFFFPPKVAGQYQETAVYIHFLTAFTCSKDGAGHRAFNMHSFANLSFNVHFKEMKSQ